MKTVCQTEELRAAVAKARAAGMKVGLVPTMGAFHEGHLSLVREARGENGFVVVSIFVNPAQFGPDEDIGKYPRDLEGDSRKLEELGVDLVFAPGVEAMYPPGAGTKVVPAPGLINRMCGLTRPGHFEGVATIVAKLFNLVEPDAAYFGQKDYQQSVVIRHLARDLDFDLEVRVLPTVREDDGLAMSSRNAYLSGDERREATALFRALTAGGAVIERGEREASRIRAAMQEVIESAKGVQTDYLEAADAETLEIRERLIPGRVVLAGAVFLGKTRLIDNILVDIPE
ncbi:MAG: pantoate--beta-alanine ligase [Planctomycetota bacterium]|nr:MAG: pantoate--beta-alanine ligase [Planctomycetota bacterium]